MELRRAGRGDTTYPGTSDAQAACTYGNVLTAATAVDMEEGQQAFRCEDGAAGLAKVGSFRASRLGLHDMLGNVWEWTWDALGDSRIVRGGGWASGPQAAQLRYQQSQPPDYRSDDLGFRIARTAPAAD